MRWLVIDIREVLGSFPVSWVFESCFSVYLGVCYSCDSLLSYTVFVEVYNDEHTMLVVIHAFHAHSCSFEFEEKYRWLHIVVVVVVHAELDVCEHCWSRRVAVQ